MRPAITSVLVLLAAGVGGAPPPPALHAAPNYEVATGHYVFPTGQWEVRRRTVALFRFGEYEAIDRMAAEYRNSQTRSPSGLWLLTAVYDGLEEAIKGDGTESAILNAEGSLQQWADRFPDSSVARIAYGIALIDHGWFFRGTGAAKTVDAENWAPFREYVEKARTHLASHEGLGKVDPHWYTATLIVARAQHWPYDDFMNLVRQGLAIHPYYYDIHFNAVTYLLPKWHGNVAAVEDFARTSVEYTREIDGESMYARVQWALSYEQLGNELFTRGRVDWPRMARGMDDVLARYPDQSNLQIATRFACMAGDRDKTRDLLARIDGKPLPRFWPSYGPGFDECREWASG